MVSKAADKSRRAIETRNLLKTQSFDDVENKIEALVLIQAHRDRVIR
jgi:hypothetical protein